MSNITENASTNAKLMSILAENGTSFNPGQKIVFNLDPSIAYMKPEESYLVFDLLNNSATNLRLAVGEAGISGLIKRVDVYSKESGALLETLQNYNKWVATQIQYTQDDKTNAINMEGVCSPSNQSKSSNVALTKAYRQNTRIYMRQEENFRCSPCAVAGNGAVTPAYTSVRFTTPLRCGIFREWDDEKLVPLLLLGGLRIELTLAPARELWTIPNVAENTLGFGVNNNTFVDGGGNANGDRTGLALVMSGNNVGGGNVARAAGVSGATDTGVFLPAGIDARECPFAVGNKVILAGTTAAPANLGVNTTITAISQGQGAGNDQVLITCAAGVGGVAYATNTRLVLRDIQDVDLQYRVTNVEFRIMREDPPNVPMKNTDYIFTTYDMFRDTVPQNQLNFTTDVTSTSSQALAMFSMYEDPAENANQDLGISQYYEGLAPGEAGFNLSSVVYFINNKLYPLRAYDPRCIGDKVITQNELVKSWGAINKMPKCLGSAHGHDLDIYTNRFLHARELARGQAVFNLQNAEPQIRLAFDVNVNNGNRGVNYKGRQIGSVSMFTYVFSKRTLQIDGEKGLTLIQ